MKGGIALFLLACAGSAVIGAIVAIARGGSWPHTLGWAFWIVGSLIVLLVGQSGSTARMAGESRVLIGGGGRFAPGSDIPLPQSPLAFIPIGAAVIAVGVLLYLA